MANTEQIEARLCAYVDGELDAAGVAEIEQHLAANPQHRALLQELVAQRQMLRDLPRDKAPEDLFENFQSQLERAVLLGAKGTGSPVAGRINPWPQILSVAAVFLLAIGLFAVIYFVLPSQQNRPPSYATVSTTQPAASQPMPELVVDAAVPAMKAAPTQPTTPAEPTPIAVAVAPVVPPPSIMAPTMTNAAREDIFSGAGSSADALASKQKNADKGYVGGAMNGLFDTMPLEPEIEQTLKDSPNLPDNCMLVVVASPRPAELDQQVTQYLAENKIRWDDVAEPMPKPLELKRSETYASKIQRPQSYELRESGGAQPTFGKGDAVPQVQKDMKQEAAQSKGAQNQAAALDLAPAAAATPAPAAPAPVATPPPPAVAAAPVINDQVQQQELAQVPPTQSAAQATEGEFARRGSPLGDVSQQPAQAMQQQRSRSFELPTAQIQQQAIPGAAANRLIVARGVTRTQLAGLNSSIVAQQNAGRLRNFTCADGSFVPTTPALSGNIITGQTITLSSGTTTQAANVDRILGAIELQTTAAKPSTQLTLTPTTIATSQEKLTTMPTSQLAVTLRAADESTTAPSTVMAIDAFDVVIVLKPTSTVAPELATEAPPAAATPAPAVTFPATAPVDATK